MLEQPLCYRNWVDHGDQAGMSRGTRINKKKMPTSQFLYPQMKAALFDEFWERSSREDGKSVRRGFQILISKPLRYGYIRITTGKAQIIPDNYKGEIECWLHNEIFAGRLHVASII